MLPLRRLQASQSLSLPRDPSLKQLLKNPHQSPPPRIANPLSPSAIRTTLKIKHSSLHPEQQMLARVRRKFNRNISKLSP